MTMAMTMAMIGVASPMPLTVIRVSFCSFSVEGGARSNMRRERKKSRPEVALQPNKKLSRPEERESQIKNNILV